MSDVRAAPEKDAGTAAPVLDDRLLIGAEIDVVGKDVAHPPETQPGGAADVWTSGDVKHRPVDPVEVLADLLDDQVDSGEGRFERRPEQVGQDRQVEGHGRSLD